MPVKYVKDTEGMFPRYSKEPILPMTKEFVENKSNDFHKDNDLRWESYYKDGCEIDKHLENEPMRVLYRDIPKMKCLKCGSQKTIKIIYVQGNIHPMCGDAYYDVEIFCSKCKVYCAFSYAEN
ncbi:hypothetical protein JW887_06325 [Candidatus Dojkabacteria bacterium]|nr:hypothetical protein [Candidatus Dojkabacteria bacterium]